jgi:hypothetical protein
LCFQQRRPPRVPVVLGIDGKFDVHPTLSTVVLHSLHAPYKLLANFTFRICHPTKQWITVPENPG